MTYYIKGASTYRVAPDNALDLHTELPVGYYSVGYDEMGGFYFLEIIDGFTVANKIYGDTQKTADRIFNTFLDREGSTGVLLSGESGSGKTLLAKLLAVKAVNDGVPVIVINEAWVGDKFNKFMQTIDQPTVVMFDEFEKVYDKDDQERMLTLLDGVYPSKKLFLLTCNDKLRVNKHMQNRPGRLFYNLDFEGLEESFIREYAEDTLLNKAHIDSLCNVAAVFDIFNFDMLKALVEEMNRYGEAAGDAVKMLNAKPQYSAPVKYEVRLDHKGLLIEATHMQNDGVWTGNPLAGDVEVYYRGPFVKDEDDDDPKSKGYRQWITTRFSIDDLTNADSEHGTYTFERDGIKLALVKIAEKKFSFYHPGAY
jgi:ATPase family associated with various cellular activities (AAA)